MLDSEVGRAWKIDSKVALSVETSAVRNVGVGVEKVALSWSTNWELRKIVKDESVGKVTR